MNAPVTRPAFLDKLPKKGPTLLQLALAAVHAKKQQREHLHTASLTREAEKRQGMLDDHVLDATEEFFAALEAETGIERALFGKLAEIA